RGGRRRGSPAPRSRARGAAGAWWSDVGRARFVRPSKSTRLTSLLQPSCPRSYGRPAAGPAGPAPAPRILYPSPMTAASDFLPLNLCVLTVSDTRDASNDTSGDYLAQALQAEGHRLAGRALLPDDKYRLRAQVSQWIADEAVDGVLVTGGTGFTGRDSTPEALLPLLDKRMPGFGELFRALSFEEIGTSSLQSRAFAGLAND